MRIDIITQSPASLEKAIYANIKDKNITAWEIRDAANGDKLLTHVAAQYKDKVLLKLESLAKNNMLRVTITRWAKETEPPKADKATILGNFVATVLTHFSDDYTKIEVI